MVPHLFNLRTLGLFLLAWKRHREEKDALSKLDPLRRRVAELDREILKLIAERLETTRAIGEIKKREGLPIRDFRVEVQVLRRAREQARELGLDERVAEDIAERLMAAAVQTQAELPQVVENGPKKRVHVAGGHGRMGHWLARYFESQGHSVRISDPRPGPLEHLKQPLSTALKNDEVVVIAANLSSTRSLLEECLAETTPENSPLIFDIASLKADIVPVLREAAGQGYKVASLHPMFAPGTVLLHGRAVLVCDAGDRRAIEEAKSLFSETALGLYEIPLEEHDRLMSVVLGLSHLINLIFGRTVARSGFPFELLGQIASTTFAKQIKTAAEVAEENPYLYHEIQLYNSSTGEIFDRLSDALTAFRQASEDSDSQNFVNLMTETVSYLRVAQGAT